MGTIFDVDLFFLSLIIPIILLSLGLTRAENFTDVVERNCNIFEGKWVFDNSYPLYNPSKCPFIDAGFNCHTRPNKLYHKYRWQPSGCHLPRFDGKEFLKKWKGKKLMFVGDSLSLNQFESLACMIHSTVPNAKTSHSSQGFLRSITFQEYEVTIMRYFRPFLVDVVKEKVGLVLKLDSIDGTAWKDIDMLIFNSWHWWANNDTTKPWDYIQDGDKLHKDMDRLIAFHKGLTTWAKWVNRNVNPSKTKVVYNGLSPTHYQGNEWNEPGHTCSDESKPFSGQRYPGTALVEAKKVVAKAIKKPVRWLDITLLSQYRIDAHPWTYSGRGKDCSHWCLPGLPDTWNQLLFSALF